MKLTIAEFTKLLTPLDETSRKALCKMDDLEVTDADGKPVEIESITLTTSATKAEGDPADPLEDPDAMKAEGDPEEPDATKAVAKATQVDQAAIDRMVKVALAAQFKAAPARARIILPPTIKVHERMYDRPVRYFAGTKNGKSASERAHRFGSYCLAILSKQIPGHFNFQKSIDFTEQHIVKLHSENINTAGGFLVLPEFSTDIIDLKEQYGVARRLLDIEKMGSDQRTIPRRTGGLTAYPVGEGAAGTESTASWDQVKLVAKDWMVLTRLTKQLDEDSVISIGDKLAYEIAYAFANKEDDCAFNGTGTSATYGDITGLRPALNNVSSNAGILTQASGTTWGAITLADFQNTVALLPQYADTPNACWIAHRAFYFGVMQRLELAAGGVTSNEIREGNRKPRPMFLGYPVEFSQVYPSSTASATIPATLGDHGLAATFGDRSQDSVEFSKEASIGGQSLWERNEIGVKGTERFDVVVHDVGSSTAAGPVVAIKTG